MRKTQQLFAHLEFGRQKMYDPVAFVEAMKLDKAEQQDAQEYVMIFLLGRHPRSPSPLSLSLVCPNRFSKLFLTYLEGHLTKQENKEVAGVIEELVCFLFLFPFFPIVPLWSDPLLLCPSAPPQKKSSMLSMPMLPPARSVATSLGIPQSIQSCN